MAVNWKDLKREIHDEVEKVWLKEPLEVTMSKLGVFPSGAGTDNQILGNLFFLNADTQAMGWWTIEPSMYCVLGDDKFSLDVCKQLFIYLNGPIAHLLGDVLEPNCPAPCLSLPISTTRSWSPTPLLRQKKNSATFCGPGSAMSTASTAGSTPFFPGSSARICSARMLMMLSSSPISLVTN